MRLTYEGSWDYENIYISADGVNVYESENIKTTSTGANALCTTAGRCGRINRRCGAIRAGPTIRTKLLQIRLG